MLREQGGDGTGGGCCGAVGADAAGERNALPPRHARGYASTHRKPFGGRHDSGLGVEYGLEGLAAYLSPQSVHRRSR